METQALKNDLIEWIRSLQDRGLLDALALFKKGTEPDSAASDLSPEAKASIARGLADIEAGRTMSSEEFWRKRGR